MFKLLFILIFTFNIYGTTMNNTNKTYFAGGCFWGVEYFLEKLDGVIEVTSGYMGGDTTNPTYQEVSSGLSQHIESVEVIYNPNKISYQALAKMFFEIHDPTQINGQGPDIGSQYMSYIFYTTKEEKQISKSLITILENKGLKIATKLQLAKVFYPAEEYHQNYYKIKKSRPYCHIYKKRF